MKSHLYWIAPFILFFAGYVGCFLIFNTNNHTTPTLIGHTVHEALALANTHRLNLRIINQKEDRDLPDGTIVSQTPAPGKSIKSHQTIYIVTTKNQSLTQVPDLARMHSDDATRMLAEHHAQYTMHSVLHHYPKGTCIGNFPTARTPIQHGHNIILYASSGSHQQVIMPDCRGKKLKDVITFLHDHHIKYSSPDTTSEQILLPVKDQRPLAGTILNLSEPYSMHFTT